MTDSSILPPCGLIWGTFKNRVKRDYQPIFLCKNSRNAITSKIKLQIDTKTSKLLNKQVFFSSNWFFCLAKVLMLIETPIFSEISSQNILILLELYCRQISKNA